MRRLVKHVLDDRAGTGALEFALVFPAFAALMIGAVYLGMLGLATSSMHFAVQEAARCASVKTTICSDSASTVTYAQARYQGPIISPVFSYNTSGCGHTVNGTATFTLVAIITSVSVPISVTACYP